MIYGHRRLCGRSASRKDGDWHGDDCAGWSWDGVDGVAPERFEEWSKYIATPRMEIALAVKLGPNK